MESLMSRFTFSGIIITNGTVHTDSESKFSSNITIWIIFQDFTMTNTIKLWRYKLLQGNHSENILFQASLAPNMSGNIWPNWGLRSRDAPVWQPICYWQRSQHGNGSCINQPSIRKVWNLSLKLTYLHFHHCPLSFPHWRFEQIQRGATESGRHGDPETREGPQRQEAAGQGDQVQAALDPAHSAAQQEDSGGDRPEGGRDEWQGGRASHPWPRRGRQQQREDQDYFKTGGQKPYPIYNIQEQGPI